MFKAFIFLGLLLSILVGCKADSKDVRSAYQELAGRFNIESAGRGVIDYPPFAEGDIPKAYAMVLTAELIRAKASGSALSDLGKKSGHWLIDNNAKDVNIGWGLPVEWDAFGDGSVNPTSTVYTITTAIVIEALLNWYESEIDVPKEQIFKLVAGILEPFAQDKINSTSGMYAYSDAVSDAKYDCFNPAGYLLGQMQRFSKLSGRKDFAISADKNVKIFLDNKRMSPSGAWYWNYSVSEDNPNDLPHATYIYMGLREYIKHGGTLTEQIDLSKVEKHFSDFKTFWNGWHAWPSVKKMDLNPKPRLYDLGIALFAFSTADSHELNGYANELFKLSRKYKRADGFYNYRPDVDKVINEYNAYMLLGLAGFSWAGSQSVDWIHYAK